MKKRIFLVVAMMCIFAFLYGCNQNTSEMLQENINREDENLYRKDENDVNDTSEKDKTSIEVSKREELSIVGGFAFVNGKLADKLAVVDENHITKVIASEEWQKINNGLYGKSLYGNGYLTTSFHYIKEDRVYKLNDFCKDSRLFDIAASGNGIAYYTTNDKISLLNAQTGVVENIECETGKLECGIVVSPDGKSMAYSNGNSIYVYSKGLYEEIDISRINGTIRIISISNGVQEMFFLEEKNNNERTVWYRNKNGELSEIVSFYGDTTNEFFLNRNNTQIGIYERIEGDALLYIYDTGNQRIVDLECEGIGIPITEYSELIYPTTAKIFTAKIMAVNCNAEDLLDCYYSSSDVYGRSVVLGMYRIEGGMMKELIPPYIWRVNLLEGGRWMYLDETRKLFIYEEGKNEKMVHDGVASFSVGTDNKTVYFITSEDELYQYREGEKELIASDVFFSSLGYICVVGSDIVIWQCNSKDETNPFGGDYYIYQNKKVEKLDTSLEVNFYGINWESTYVNPSIRLVESGRGTIFTTAYLPYKQDGKWYVLYENGDRTHVNIE